MTFKKGLTRTVNKMFVAMKSNMSYICMAFGLFSALVVLLSWLYGYWSNGLWGTHFEINSCWQGISACGMGLVGLFKWLVDSTKNSPTGEYPIPPNEEQSSSICRSTSGFPQPVDGLKNRSDDKSC